MSIEISKIPLGNIRELPGHPGGVTYYVIIPLEYRINAAPMLNDKGEQALCFRPMKRDNTKRCTLHAGFDTSHLGYGSCKFHGGRAIDSQYFSNGRQSVMTKTLLKDTLKEFLKQDKAELLDLTYELAAAKAIMRQMIEEFPEAGSDNPIKDMEFGKWLRRFNESIGTLGNLVEKISRVDNRNALTAAEVLYMRAVLVDVFMKYVPDPMLREKAVKEFADRLGGDVKADLKPREFRKIDLIAK
jgi:hypothetical protein